MSQPVSTTASTIQAPPAMARVNRFTRAFRWARLIVHIGIALALVGAVFPRVSERRRARITHWWSRKTLRIFNVVLSVCGARPHEDELNLMIASNHVSWLDIFVINAAHPARFVAKAEIREWPIAGWICERAGTIFIRRAKRSDTARTKDEMHDALAAGATIGFFPEGTTTAGDRLHKFHTSLFEPAVVNRASLAPAAVRYLTSESEPSPGAAYIDDLSFAESLAQIIGQKSMIAEITFAPRIDATGKSRRELAIQTEAAVAAILNVPIPTIHRRFDATNPNPALE
jgi:1-acyl-sn-glycerol-3-phosphate acyltransferase